MTRHSDVLVVGAGPTGLALALWLVRLGIKVRIIDKAPEPGATSRALVVHARTLEYYRQLGIADDVLARGVKFTAANIWVRGRQVGRIPFGDIGVGISAFPYMLIFPQDEHERLLIAHLEALGVTVDRRAEMVQLEQAGDGITAVIRRPGQADEQCYANYLTGCDGAHSRVRELLGIGFPGGTYEHLFYVADLASHGPAVNGEFHIAFDDADFLGVFPMKGDARARLIGSIRDEAVGRRNGGGLTWDDVGHHVIERMRLGVERVNWFSTYHVHHRVAAHFQRGRAFLLGDAAHVHSPVGGQGMNTGIGDASNLAWKLAAAVRDGRAARMLDSYEPERIAFARRLVATTDRAFTIVTRRGGIARYVRVYLAPHVVPKLLAPPAARRYAFRTLSQTAIEYRESPLSTGAAGHVRAGDRLPWVQLGTPSRDNYESLSRLDWQVHVYGTPASDLRGECETRRLTLCELPWAPALERSGLARDAIYLVRPDGHVAFAGGTADTPRLRSYLDAWSIAPLAP